MKTAEKTIELIESARLYSTHNEICEIIHDAGGRAFLVGGCVRDALLGLESQDIDIEAYGIEPKRLQRVLQEHYDISLVGQAFGVIKIKGFPIDVSIPRLESKMGLGHKAFDVQSDPFLDPREAASRRDFTINAIAYDPLTKSIVDPFDGIGDVQKRILRHTSPKFVEDPLRVLRGMQFVSRFELDAAPETIALCQTIEPEGIARERFFDEWKKLILQGIRPSLGLKFLEMTGWIQYYPELLALTACPQEPEWHPEGNVWQHTLRSLDAFAGNRLNLEEEDLVVGFAVLCHDFGKPSTTTTRNGHIVSPGHDAAAEQPAANFLRRLTDNESFIHDVLVLVRNHMMPHQLFSARAGDSAVRRLAVRVGRIDRLVRVDQADRNGRLQPDNEECSRWLLEKAHELDVEKQAPKPIVMGRHLIEMGMEPGLAFTPILEACYEAQLEGKFSKLDDGLAYALKLISDR